MLAVVADSVIARTVGAVTVTTVLPLLDGFAVLVAVIVACPAPTAVTNPAALTVAMLFAFEPQMTVVGVPVGAVTVAVN